MSQQETSNDVLSLTIEDKAALHSAYMPFVRRGGLFVPTAQPGALGREVELRLRLPDDPEPVSVAGTVVWVTPRGAQGGRAAGVGVQFAKEGAAVQARIENHLAGSLESAQPTHTL